MMDRNMEIIHVCLSQIRSIQDKIDEIQLAIYAMQEGINGIMNEVKEMHPAPKGNWISLELHQKYIDEIQQKINQIESNQKCPTEEQKSKSS